MALDPRIPLMAQGPQLEPIQNQLAKAFQLRAAENQLAEQGRVSQQRNALAGVLPGAFDDNGRLTAGSLGRIAQAAPDYAPDFARMAQTQQRLDRQDQQAGMQSAMAKQQWARQGFAVSNSPQEAARYIQDGVQSGILSPEEGQRGMAQIPQDPTQFGQWKQQMLQLTQGASGGYGAPVFTDQGIAQFDKQGNYKVAMGADGKPLRPASFDPTTQAAVAGAKTTATKEAEKAVEKPAKMVEAQTALDSTSSSLDRMASVAQEILSDPAISRITGLTGMAPSFPGGEAANLEAKVQNLKSQVGFSVLQAMRDASKTGGALGAISDKENELLQNNLAALNPRQSPEQFKQELQKIINYANEAKGRLSGAFKQQYGSAQAAPGGVLSAPAAQPAAAGRTVVRRGTLPDGRRVVQYSDGSTALEQ